MTLRLPRRASRSSARTKRSPGGPGFHLPYTPQHGSQFVSFARSEAEKGTGAHFMVCDQGGLVIGSCGLVQIDWADLVAEVGYWVGAEAQWPRGCNRLFESRVRVGLPRATNRALRLRTAAPNTASNAVARGIGFVLEGTERQGMIAGHSGRRGSTRFDLHLYGLLPGELIFPK
ncbi:MAG: GNAT family N-acetyltransferase [Nitriliruptorales bacterium]